MKGVGDIVSTIIIVVAMVISIVIYMSIAWDESQKEINLNLREAEIFRAKNTVSLLNRSLAMTWHLSTVQTIFLTGDESIGCGSPNDPEAALSSTKPELLPGYWYKYDPTAAKDDEESIKGELDSGNKYYAGSPSICYPRDSSVVLWLEETFGAFREATQQAVANFKSNEMDVKVSEIHSSISLNSGSVSSITAQKAELSAGSIGINTELVSRSTVFTEMQKIVSAGRRVVDIAIATSDLFRTGDGEFNREYLYNDLNSGLLGVPPTANKEAYLNSFNSRFLSFLEASIQDVRYVPKKERLELLPPSSAVSGVTASQQGLVLHYRYSLTFFDSERVTVSGDSIFDWPTGPSPPGSRRITSCYGNRLLGGEPDFHDGLDIGAARQGIDGDPVFAADDGTVERAISGCAVGNTGCGNGYGNNIIINHGDRKTLYGHLKGIVVEKGDDVDRGQLIGHMGNTGKSTAVHLHFEVRESDRRVNPCAFITCEESTGLSCTSETVTDSRGFYYYHSEFSNQFVSRPFSMPMAVEDYLPAINCQDAPYGPSDTDDPAENLRRARLNGLRTFSWEQPGDMVCCSGLLYTCNVDLGEGPWSLSTGESVSDSQCPALQFFGVRKLECTAGGLEVSANP